MPPTLALRGALDRRVHLPSCQIIDTTIRNPLKMPMLDQGGAAVADNNFNNGSSLYDNNKDNDDNEDEDDKE